MAGTPGKREQKKMRIDKVGGTGLVCLKWNQGGELPPVLKGMFTSAKKAVEAVTKYNGLNDKEVEIV